jgi:phenylpropionate dioxygenase-like ring-hydroxylating dioxygenase large terminal subunit
MDLDTCLIGNDNVVPRARYTSAEFSALEFERLWARVRQVACREEEIGEVGEFCEYTIGDQSVLVVRLAPDTVQAFHYTCLHRGTRLADGSVRIETDCIRCRYHAWRYDFEGRRIEVVDPEEFEPIPPGLRLWSVRAER